MLVENWRENMNINCLSRRGKWWVKLKIYRGNWRDKREKIKICWVRCIILGIVPELMSLMLILRIKLEFWKVKIINWIINWRRKMMNLIGWLGGTERCKWKSKICRKKCTNMPLEYIKLILLKILMKLKASFFSIRKNWENNRKKLKNLRELMKN